MKKLRELIWKADGLTKEGTKGNEIIINGKHPIALEDLRAWAIKKCKEIGEDMKKVELGLSITIPNFEKEELRKESLWHYYYNLEGRKKMLMEMFEITVEDLK